MSAITTDRARELAWRKFGLDADLNVGEWVREARRALRFLVDRTDEAEAHVAELTEERNRYRTALQKIARAPTPPEREGHYLAHRQAVKLARDALGRSA